MLVAQGEDISTGTVYRFGLLLTSSHDYVSYGQSVELAELTFRFILAHSSIQKRVIREVGEHSQSNERTRVGI